MKIKRPKGPWAIIVVALLLVAVFLILGNLSFKATERANLHEFNQRQLVLAREATGGIELYFESLAGDMRALARRPEVQQLDEAPTREEIENTFDKLEPMGVNDIGVLGPEGVLRYNVAAPQIEGDNFSWRRYYQETKAMISDDAFVIEFIEFKGVEAGQKGVLVAVPMFATASRENYPAPPGQFAGVIVCTLKLDTLTQKFVASIQSSKRGHAFLIDDEYNVLWAPERSLFGKNLLKEGEGFPQFQQIVETMSAGDSGAAEYSYYRFEESTAIYTRGKTEQKLIAYAPIHLGNELWSVGVWAPKQGAQGLIRSVYLVQLLIIGLSILATILGSSYALVRLQDSYRRVAQERSKVVAAIEASQNAIWLSDADHRIVMVNSAMEALTGRRREELLGQTCRNLLSMCSVDSASICDTICPILRPPSGNGRVEALLSTPAGEEIWSEVSYGRVVDTDDRLAGVVHIVHDLTERKEIERLKDEFISTVSHELRTPLSHIKGFATTLLQTDVEWDKATEQDFLESISGEADRLTNLVEKILHLSRLEADGLPMEKEWYQVNDLVNEALQRRRGVVRDREVRMHLAASLPALFVDGREIEVVLMNLIENAAKYSDPSSPITLGSELEGDQVVFSVSDQGTGIPPDEVDKIFERFYRAEGVGRGSAGTGLGLAICRRIVEAHSGRIWVESTSGTGSCFCFSLPMDGTANETT